MMSMLSPFSMAVLQSSIASIDCVVQDLWEEAVLSADEQTVFTEVLEESISDNGFKNFDRDASQSHWSIA